MEAAQIAAAQEGKGLMGNYTAIAHPLPAWPGAGRERLPVSNPEAARPQDRAAALEYLMQTYGTKVLHLAYFYLKDRHLAEDVAQEVFIKAYHHWDEFRGDSSVYTWLYRITANLCRDKQRGGWLKRFLLTDDDSRFEGEAQGPEAEVLQKHDRESLLAYVMQLPDAYREVVVLYYYQELSVLEIADVTGQKENTVKTRMRRGRQLLKELLEREGGER